MGKDIVRTRQECREGSRNDYLARKSSNKLRIYFGGQNGFFSNYHILISSDNASFVADFDVCGHLHQHMVTRRYCVNGSVVGYSPYGMASRSFFKGEPPTQAYFLVDKKRRVTVNIPILLN